VQFHPESIASEHGHRMLLNFLEGAGVPLSAPLRKIA
jgi:anthranilate synthase component 2